MPKRKAPLAILITFGSVCDADARGGDELDARAVAFKPEAIGVNEVLAFSFSSASAMSFRHSTISR